MPPVQSNSPSEASLRRDFVLSQDKYGSRTSISLPWNDFPVPGLAVGRLVETASEIAGTDRRVCRGRLGRVAAHLARDRLRLPRGRGERGQERARRRHRRCGRRADHAERHVAAGCRLVDGGATAHEAVRVAPRRDLPRRAFQRQQRARRGLRDQPAHDRPRGLDDGLHQLDRVQRRLPRRLQPRRRRRDPRRDAAARLGAGVRQEEGDADRRHRLPVRRHRLPRVQRAALQQFRAAAARRRAGTPSRSARRWCRRSSTTSRRRRTSAASTRRRCSRRRCSACRCSA